MKIDKAKSVERVFKGLANHWRLRVLYLLHKDPGLTLWQISKRLKANQKTMSEHTRRLVHSGLVTKKYRGREVRHHISAEGRDVLAMIAPLTGED